MGIIEIENIEYNDEYANPMTLCLGFFDALHLGHKKLIDKARLLAHRYNSKIGVFTFKNNPFSVLGNSSFQVTTFDERCYRLETLGVDLVLSALFDEKFSKIKPTEFLDNIFLNKNVKAVVVGSDYTYGLRASGNVCTLAEYCKIRNIELVVEDLKYDDNGKKLSSRDIRTFVAEGRVDEIFLQLGTPYIVIGKVVRGRGDGKKNYFPTANIEIDKNKVLLGTGVYYCRVIIDGVSLKAVCNVGPHPTYDDLKYNIEAHILYFNKDIYGKEIVIEFFKRLRDTQKFESKKKLQEVIEKDVQQALELD